MFKKIKNWILKLDLRIILGFTMVWSLFTLGMSRNGTLAEYFRNEANFDYNKIDGYALAGWLVVGPIFILALYWILAYFFRLIFKKNKK